MEQFRESLEDERFINPTRELTDFENKFYTTKLFLPAYPYDSVGVGTSLLSLVEYKSVPVGAQSNHSSCKPSNPMSI